MNEIRDRLTRLAEPPAVSSPPDAVFSRATGAAAHIRRRRTRRRATGGGAAMVAVAVTIALVIHDRPADNPVSVRANETSSSSSIAPTTTPTCTHLPTLTAAVPPDTPLPRAPTGPNFDYARRDSGTTDPRGNTFRAGSYWLVTKTGPDGTIALVHGDKVQHPNNYLLFVGWGDFDGDGRDDFLVDVYSEGVAGSELFIVSGALPPGTYDAAMVGIRVPYPHAQPDEVFLPPIVLPDMNGDGADDIAFGRYLVSGRALAAFRVGDPKPVPFRTLTSAPIGLLQLDAKGPPTFVLRDHAPSDLVVLDARGDRLVTTPRGYDQDPELSTWLVNGHHILQADVGNRSGDEIWRWDLDGPCGQ